jgi:hypothetical protein
LTIAHPIWPPKGALILDNQKRLNEEREIQKDMAERHFVYGARWLLSWKMSARSLKRAADKVFENYQNASKRDEARSLKDFQEHWVGTRELTGQELADYYDEQMGPVYLFLIASAIENLFKGIAINRHPDLLKDNKQLSKPIRTHKLDQLVDTADISVDLEERQLLHNLSIYIEWQGRYPIPLTLSRLTPEDGNDESRQDRKINLDVQGMYEQIERIYCRLWAELEKERIAQPPYLLSFDRSPNQNTKR